MLFAGSSLISSSLESDDVGTAATLRALSKRREEMLFTGMSRDACEVKIGARGLERQQESAVAVPFDKTRRTAVIARVARNLKRFKLMAPLLGTILSLVLNTLWHGRF